MKLLDFRNRFPGLRGNTLSFWLYAPEAITAADLPLVILSNAREGLQVAEFPGSFTDAIPLGQFTGDLPAGKWARVHIPLSAWHSASIYEFQPGFLQDVIFRQNKSDGARHTLIVDEIRVEDVADAGHAQKATAALAPPTDLKAIGYDRHVRIPLGALTRCLSCALHHLPLSRRAALRGHRHTASRYVSVLRLPWQVRRESGVQGQRLRR